MRSIAAFQFQRTRFVPHESQVRFRFRMMRLKGERAFVIQNRVAEIACAKMRVAQIVKNRGARLAGSRPNFRSSRMPSRKFPAAYSWFAFAKASSLCISYHGRKRRARE